jgi:hypothetical protein
MGCHPKSIDELHHFSEGWLNPPTRLLFLLKQYRAIAAAESLSFHWVSPPSAMGRTPSACFCRDAMLMMFLFLLSAFVTL